MQRTKKKVRVQYTMEATQISSGNPVSWVSYDEPDYGGLKSGYSPSSLTGVKVQKSR